MNYYQAMILLEFRDYWIAQPGQKGVKLNWDATYRNWIRNQKVFRQPFTQQTDIAKTTVPSSKERDPILKKIEEDSKNAVPMPDNVREFLIAMKGK